MIPSESNSILQELQDILLLLEEILVYNMEQIVDLANFTCL